MTALAPQTSTLAGVSATFTAAATGQTIPADGRCVAVVKNTDSSTHTVTVKSYAPAGVGTAQADSTSIAVPATTGVVVLGPFGAAFDNGSGQAELTWSATTGMSVAVIRVNPA